MQYKTFPEDVQLSLGNDEALQLASCSIDLARYDISDPYLYRHEDFEEAAWRLSGPTFDCLRGFAACSNSYGTLYLRGLPIDPILPNTPMDGRRPARKLSVSEAALAVVGCLIGDIFSYNDEKEGLLIQNICPVRGQEHRQENTGSAFLEFHTEDSFHPLPPDLLMLVCLRGDRSEKAITATASITRVFDVLDTKTIDILSQPNFIIRSSSSFGQSIYTKRVSILTGANTNLGLIFDPSAMTATDEVSAAAMQRLHEALGKETYGVCLHPGEAILIDNTKACHARTGFAPFYDGHDRWLQRIFLTRRFSAYGDILVPGTRMVDPASAREVTA